MVREPVFADVLDAAQRIAPYVHRTPVFTSATLDRMIGAEVFFKAENLQKVGAFKARGACNAVFALSQDQAARGVVTHSSGKRSGRGLRRSAPGCASDRGDAQGCACCESSCSARVWGYHRLGRDGTPRSRT